MLYHRAGINYTNEIRYGINNMFAIPLIKQQIDIARFFINKSINDLKLQSILGIPYITPMSFEEYRNNKLTKKK